MLARLILDEGPGAHVTFDHRGIQVRALMDPMEAGPEYISQLLDDPRCIFKLLDRESQVVVGFDDPFNRGIFLLLENYLEAVGLSFKALGRLVLGLEQIHRLEIDLLRIGFEVRDWLDPEGALSSRRVALLIEDFLDRPETRLGAYRLDLMPISKEAIIGAQQLGKPEEPHQFLKSVTQLEAEASAQREREAAIERMKKREA